MITVGRLLLIPPVLLLVGSHNRWAGFLAMLLFMMASLLDIVDGWLARRRGLVTVFGKFVDPLADKIMVMSLLVYLVAADRIPPWMVVVMLGRDFYISGLRSVASAEGVVIAAGEGGKAKTGFQLIGICFVLVHFRYRMLGMDDWVDYHKVGLVLLYVSLVLSIVSAIQYTAEFRDALQQKRTG